MTLVLPSRKIEAWHYTDLSQIDLDSYELAEPVAVPPPAPGVLHWVNGTLAVGSLPDGVRLEPWREEGSLWADPERAMLTLNQERFTQAWVLTVAAGSPVSAPLQLIFETRGNRIQCHPRLQVILEEGASLRLTETHHGAGSVLSNSVVEFHLGAAARLDHVRVQRDQAEALHIGSVGVRLAAASDYQGIAVNFGAKLARLDLEALLAGSGANFSLSGATLAGGKQHLDNTTRVIHRAPRCTSHQLFKTVLSGEGHGVFQGTVLVERAAQKTHAHQLSRALMLSDRSQMDNKPELEIYADDVKCGHGATILDLDAQQLFYLRARGIDLASARQLLIEAFLAEILEGVTDAGLADQLAQLLRDALPMESAA